MNGLLRSRKFYLAVFGIAQALVFEYLSVPDEVWQSIAALVGVLIASIAIEDAGANMAGPQLTGTISPAAKIEAEKQAGLVPGEGEEGHVAS